MKKTIAELKKQLATHGADSLTVDELVAVKKLKDLSRNDQQKTPLRTTETEEPKKQGSIIELPKRRSPKQLARAYMMGELHENDYPIRGGLRNAMLLADGAESEIARMQAVQFIEELADLSHEQDANQVIDLKLVAIENRDGKIVEVESA